MKVKIGPVEIEQDAIKDEILYNEYKESPKTVEKYLAEKSKFYDMTLKHIIAGKTTKMVRDFIFTIAGGVLFTGWVLYVLYISRDAFVWKEISLNTAFTVIMEVLLMMVVCFMPAGLVGGCLKLFSMFNSRRAAKKAKPEAEVPDNKK